MLKFPSLMSVAERGIPGQKERTRTPQTLLDRLSRIVGRVIQAKRDFLIEKFGDASDFGIRGIVVVGDPSQRTIPTGRLDALSVYVLSEKPGYDGDFVDQLAKKTQRRVVRQGTILIEPDQVFTRDDWKKERERKSIPDSPFRVILAPAA